MDFFDDCVKQLERFRALGPPPKGVKLHFQQPSPGAQAGSGSGQSSALVSVTWDYMNGDIEIFVRKLKEAFPEWSWWTNKPG